MTDLIADLPFIRGDEPYDPELDQCARYDGQPGCRNDDGRRVRFNYFGLTFCCPQCYENHFGGPPDPESIITIGALGTCTEQETAP